MPPPFPLNDSHHITCLPPSYPLPHLRQRPQASTTTRDAARQDSPFSTYPTMHLHVYHPTPHNIDKTWTGAITVYNYLIKNPSERDRLRTEVSLHHPHEPITVTIWHKCLSGQLRLSNLDSDSTFYRHIESCLRWELQNLKFLTYYDPFSQGTTWNNNPTTHTQQRSCPAIVWVNPGPPQLKPDKDEVSTQSSATRRGSVLTSLTAPSTIHAY